MSEASDSDLPMRLPLTGMHLIEASAGTGKTHALVLLLLRAIVVEGYEPRELIAATYTRAAAGELRERTRVALAHAAKRAAKPDASMPAHLSDPIDTLISEALARDALLTRPMLARRLRAAELGIDAIWLGTIHSICQRLLIELGPVFGTPDIGEQVDEGGELFATACADAWRAVQADRHLPGLAAALPETPEKLAKLLEPIIAMPSSALVPPEAPDATELDKRSSSFETAWHRAYVAAQDVAALIAAIDDRKRYGITKDGVSDKTVSRFTRLMASYFSVRPGTVSVPDEFCSLTAENLANSVNRTRKNVEPLPEHPLPQALTALVEAESAWRNALRIAMMHRLHAEVRARLERMGFEQGRVRFDDLVSRVAELLAAPDGHRLIERVRERWRLALIDEFQDTDAEQYAVFSALFGNRLIMVGDPKQAIYRFRGGDVHAYHKAKLEADGIARLSVCRRAEKPLVDAVNALFDERRLEHPFREAFIDYEAVDCAYDSNRHGTFHMRGRTAAGLCVWPMSNDAGGGWSSKDEARRRVTVAVGQEIVELLDPARTTQLVFPDGGHRRLAASDIAVLCQTRAECIAVAAELRRRRVSVDLGVAPAMEARAGEDLRRLLAAWLAPQDSGRLRALALSGLYGLTLDRLPESAEASPLPRERLADFSRQVHWTSHGDIGRAVLDAVKRGAGIAKAAVDGEMLIDAWLRLADRIVRWALPGHGLNAVYIRLRRWLSTTNNARTLASASESSDAVRVMTIHASKGLEFGVVFAPFLWDRRDPARNRSHHGLIATRFHDTEGRLRVDVGSPDFAAHQRVADEEERAEGIRKAYVAVTRARHRLYLPIAVTKSAWCESAMGHLLPGVDAGSSAGLDIALRGLSAIAPSAIEVCGPPEFAARTGFEIAAVAPVRATVMSVRTPRDDFRVMSYSRLTRTMSDEVRDIDQATPLQVDAQDGIGHLRGAVFGTCFHAMMEAAISDPMDRDAFARIAAAHGFGEPRDLGYLQRLVAATMKAELPGGRRLCDLASSERSAEMEFFVPMRDLTAKSLNETLASHEAYRRPDAHWPALPGAIHGYLRGFIDLVYRIDDRYYVLDYKTNDLGIDTAAYSRESLRESIRFHDYDLQYLIYLVALQRLLRSRLAAQYRPERNLGGAVYLFVRGLDHDGVHFDRPPQSLVDQLETVLCGDES